MTAQHPLSKAEGRAHRSYLDGLRQLLAFLPSRRRGQGVLVLLCMLVAATAEFLTLGAVLPFLALVADPAAADRQPQVKALLGVLQVQPDDAVVVLAMLFGALAVVTAGIRILVTWISQKFAYRLGHDLGAVLYEFVLRQPYSFHTAKGTSVVLSSMNKVQQIVLGILIPTMQIMISATVALFLLTGLLLVNAKIAIGSAALFGLIYLMISAFTRAQLKRNGEIIARNTTARLKTVQEGLGGIRDVIIDQAQPMYVRKFARLDTTIRDAQAANAMIGATPRFVLEGLGMAAIAMLTLQLSRSQGGLQAALPILGALAIGAQRLLPLLQQIYSSWAWISGNQAILFEILDLLGRPGSATANSRHPAPIVPFEKSIRLQNVSFRHGESAPLVAHDVNLEIFKSTRVGFIGRTGSGKSTIIDLIMGLLTPTSGSVLVDGLALNAENVPGWWRQISHVPQTIYLSDATILENIAFGIDRDEIDEARVREAARQADIEEFILSRKGGYQAVVGERGIQLSGGQRQRIGLARALYRKSSVLIFDEATNALDTETEDSIMQSIETIGGDVTVLIVGHRLNTLKNCDVIFRIEEGRVAEHGTYEQVVAASGLPA